MSQKQKVTGFGAGDSKANTSKNSDNSDSEYSDNSSYTSEDDEDDIDFEDDEDDIDDSEETDIESEESEEDGSPFSDYSCNSFGTINRNTVAIKPDRSPVNALQKKEAYCFDVCTFAEKFVDAIFIEAKRKVILKKENVGYLPLDELYNSVTSESMKRWFNDPRQEQNALVEQIYTDWPKISEFNIKLGLEKLEAYVHHWERSSDWVFCVEFLGFESEDCSNIFVYEVEWSKPMKMYPIPQVTASVYFGLEVFKMIPPSYDRLVDVTYIFECSNVIHRPGRIDFQEKWLEDIVQAKLRFFKSVTFAVSIIFISVCLTSSEKKYKSDCENFQFTLNRASTIVNKWALYSLNKISAKNQVTNTSSRKCK